jgi:hypothetical protein
VELSKAAAELAATKAKADSVGMMRSKEKMSVLTAQVCRLRSTPSASALLPRGKNALTPVGAQLDASNPVLTLIADAMAAEGAALRRLQEAPAGSAAMVEAEADVVRWQLAKDEGNAALQVRALLALLATAYSETALYSGHIVFRPHSMQAAIQPT